MIIWSGHGILIAVAAIGGAIAGSVLFAIVGPLQNFVISGSAWGGALAVLLYAKTIGKTKKTVLLDPQTQQNVVHRSSHTLFFIPAFVWAVLFLLGATFVTVINFMMPDPADASRAEQHTPGMVAFNNADRSIMSNSKGSAKGNSEEAIRLAKDFSSLLADLRNLGVEQTKKKMAPSLSGGEFVTFCHLTEDHCVFLVHVPALRKFTDGAKAFISEAAWIAGTSVIEKNNLKLSKMGVGVKGVVFYSTVWIGEPSTDFETVAVKQEGVSAKELLYPLFAKTSAQTEEKEIQSVEAPEPSKVQKESLESSGSDDIEKTNAAQAALNASETQPTADEPEEANISKPSSADKEVPSTDASEMSLPTAMRDWKSLDGKTLRARLNAISEDGLSGDFVREDGKKFTVPKERFSEEDRALIEKLFEAVRGE